MSSRALLLPAMLLGSALASCPGVEEAHPEPAIVAIAPQPPPIAKPSGAPATTPAAIGSPANESVLPPELVDDGSDDVPELEPPPPPPIEKSHAPHLASIGRETWVYSEPRWSARRIGYLRAGAVVDRRDKPIHRGNCSDGWYRIEPRGYVCVNFAATLDESDPVVQLSSRRPVRDTLPYPYVMSRFPPPPLYARFPDAKEVLDSEPDLAAHLREFTRMSKDVSYVEPPPADELPPLLKIKKALPGLAPTKRGSNMLSLGHAKTRSGFALLGSYDVDGRRFGLTTDLALLPLDRTRVIKPSTFHGVELDDETTLPVAFVKSHHATRFTPNPGGGVVRGAELGFREAVPVTNITHHLGGTIYLEAKDGTWLDQDKVVTVEPAHNAPAWSQGDRKWIDVSILHQSLVAYRGKKPVYVTLVSTGADGLGDPKKTHSTILGAFLIHTKHLSVTMDDKINDEFDFRDVPFVQYFTEGFALHAAYWHDDFGTPRSHGCVNLAPIDAAWLFGFTDPDVPPAWHAALSLKKGTLVNIHP